MSLIYDNEQARRSKGLLALNDMFSARTDNHCSQLMPTVVSDKGSSDGHMLGPHHAAYCVAEFKNESAGVSAIPYVETTSYFAHTIRQATQVSPSVMRGWNFPCLGLTIIDTLHIILTPGLSCIWVSGEGNDRLAFYAAFTAASVFLACIEKEATKLVRNPPAPIEGSLDLPHISRLRLPDSDAHIDFKILLPELLIGIFTLQSGLTARKSLSSLQDITRSSCTYFVRIVNVRPPSWAMRGSLEAFSV
ncbi:hypothetical protein J3R83DRAFT_3061 [Lanmaoa asiatica]|nr:hypothetical protein J3R83DRAFT_3061 [Lanmaoa asiatica]